MFLKDLTNDNTEKKTLWNMYLLAGPACRMVMSPQSTSFLYTVPNSQLHFYIKNHPQLDYYSQ